MWCQAQELRMNSSFNAYLLPERPRLRRMRHHVKMRRGMVLEDDIKEFWCRIHISPTLLSSFLCYPIDFRGFYLLRGSSVRLSVCARHEGASFIVVKVGGRTLCRPILQKQRKLALFFFSQLVRA